MTETREAYEVTSEAKPTLEEQVKRVHALRLAYDEICRTRDELYEQFKRENRAVFDLMESTCAELSEASARLREMALAEYAATGSKQPAPGVGIRVVTRILYDEQQALDWARAHGLALALDRKAFERIAKADPESVREVATITEEATATIANDLSPYVPEAS